MIKNIRKLNNMNVWDLTKLNNKWYITPTWTIQEYGACSSVVERQIVDLVVVGSIPTRHPLLF